MYNLVKATKALSDETRLRILNLLLQRECCVCEVMLVLGISQTRASRNLGMLYDAGFLKLRKAGLWAHYSIDRDNLDEYLSALLKAAELGLKNNPEAAQDNLRLKEVERLESKCCNNNQEIDTKALQSMREKL